MQNTIIKEFENNPDVSTILINADDLHESLEWAELLWSKYYMRQPIIWEDDGTFFSFMQDTVELLYGALLNGLPFGRAYIIDGDGIVVYSTYGYNPGDAIEKIYRVLRSSDKL